MELFASIETFIRPGKNKKMNIVVIDESPLILKVIKDFLTDLGNEVSTFGSWSELQESGAEDEIDLVIIDLEAPKVQSQKTISEINDRYPSADIVIMYEGKTMLDSQEAISHKVYSYLVKPIRLAELELLITRVREKRAFNP